MAAVSSCGGGSDPSPVAAAVLEVQDAFADKEMKRACAKVTTSVGRHVGRAGHDPPKGCSRDLAGLAEMFAQGERMAEPKSRPSREPPEVDDFIISGRRATATLTGANGSVARVPLARRSGEWKLDALYGGVPARRQLSKRAWTAAAPPPESQVTDGAVTVTRRSGGGKAVPCPPLRGVGTAKPRGGCTIRANSSDIDVFVLTAMREFLFGNCYFSFTMHVDSTGRLALERAGLGGDSPCNDAPACFVSDAGSPYPWRGWIHRDGDGKLVATLDACFDTCLGRFEGRTDLELRNRPDGWIARASDATVGTSGWKLDGDLGLEADGLEIEPRGGG